MLRLSCNNELDSCSTSVSCTGIKKNCVEIQGTEMAPLEFLVQLSGCYESHQDYRVWNLKIFITENMIGELIMTGWKDMLTAKKQSVWENN